MMTSSKYLMIISRTRKSLLNHKNTIQDLTPPVSPVIIAAGGSGQVCVTSPKRDGFAYSPQQFLDENGVDCFGMFDSPYQNEEFPSTTLSPPFQFTSAPPQPIESFYKIPESSFPMNLLSCPVFPSSSNNGNLVQLPKPDYQGEYFNGNFIQPQQYYQQPQHSYDYLQDVWGVGNGTPYEKNEWGCFLNF